MADIIQTRRDLAANWTSVNPILADGEKGFETDTGQEKIGDGASIWTLLPYISGGGGGIAAVVEDLTPQLGGGLDINGFPIFSVPDSDATNSINIVAGSTNYDNDESQASEINLVGGDHLTAGAGPGRAGGINLTGGALPNATGATPTAYGGGIILTGGNVPEAAEAWGGVITLRGGDSYSASGRSNGGRIHLKGGEAYDFPGDIWLEPGGFEGIQTPDPMVVIRANHYVGALGNYGGDELTTILAFEGLQSNTTLGSNSERIKDNFVGIKAPDDVPVAYIVRLPAAPPSGPGEALITGSVVGGATDLVWAVPGGGGGGVDNPMTANLVTGGFNIVGADGAVGQPLAVKAGGSTGAGNYGGALSLYGGNSDLYSGGSVRLIGGNTSAAYAGGDIASYGGSPLGVVGNGGRIILRGGDGGATSGTGGDIILEPGSADPGSSIGAVVIPDKIVVPTVTTNKLYNSGGDLYWDGIALNGQSGGSITGQYKFETSIAVAPPTGVVRFNNAVLASVTELFISQTSDDGFDALNFLNGLSAGNQIYIQDPKDAADFAVWSVTGGTTDEGTWFRVPATLVNGGDPIVNGVKISTSFLYTTGGGGGTIGGAITNDQVAVGAATANNIEGSAKLTWDGNNVFEIGGGTSVSPILEINGAAGANSLIRFQEVSALQASIGFNAFANFLEIKGQAVGTDILINPGAVTGRTKITAIEAPLLINAQVGVTYTGIITDADVMITLSNAAAIAMTIPANASVIYPIGTKLNFMQLGAGQVTVGITSDTLNVEAGLTKKLKGQFAVATALKVTATTWTLFGNLEAV